MQLQKGASLCWEFKLDSKDIDFHVEGPSGETAMPAARHDSTGDERIVIELMPSDRRLEASREGSK